MTTPRPRPTQLRRSASDRLLVGVCGGLAEHLRVPAIAVRGAMVVLVLAGGAGVLLYLWLWATVPVEDPAADVQPLRRALTKPAAGSAAKPGTGPATDVNTAADTGVSAAGEAKTTPAAKPGTMPGSAPGTAPGAATPHALAAAAASRTVVAAPRTQDPPPRAPVPAPSTPAPTPRTAAPTPRTTAPAQPSPSSHTHPSRARRGRWPVAELLFGTCLLFVGVLLVLQQLGVELRLTLILPALAVLVGVGLTWWQVADRNSPETNQVPRVLGALALVAVGVLMFFVTAENPSVWTVIAAALAALAGVALAIAPWLLRLNRELIAERAGREREAERSEIAAHLHDSVLQTLALIQQRSEPGSEVSRIARGQERELREWLFRAADGGSAAPRETALEELRAHAAALEDAHPVRFETVGVGAEVAVPEPIVAAAREAMLNAAQHAGGDVTVFAEVTPTRVSIDVTDRGPGLDLARLPEGRMGVRDSILGRMSRAGGTARIVPGPGGNGTSVRLEMPREQKSDPAGDAGAGVSP